MSTVDDLRDSINKEIRDYEEFLSHLKDLVQLVPQVQEWNEEAQTKLVALDNLPDDVLVENAPLLFEVQVDEQRQRQEILPHLPEVRLEVSVYAGTSGSTTSVLYESATRAIPTGGSVPPWMSPIHEAYQRLVENKVQKATLPEYMGAVRQDLRAMFTLANSSFDQAKSSIIGTDQATIRMRDVIEQLWGALVEHAKRKCGDIPQKQGLELRRELHRHQIADCLGVPTSQKVLTLHLDDLYKLHQDLTPGAKKPLEHDVAKLEELHTRWILQIGAIIRTVLQSIN